ncbi:MAG: NAD-dependent protein deacylase [Verrucomicrobiota bacterium JB023]|nr:NAD-dependent protein deacylase [Verrucomicrobiota bacterium JB023]
MSETIVILTGAGISAESGIRTFRGPDGLWEGHRVEDVATPEGFEADPVLVQRFYNERRRALLDGILPNAAHTAIARLQREWPGDVLLVTQHIDHLHEQGGSPQVLHMHGELLKARCTLCQAVQSWEQDLSAESVCTTCETAGGMRPHVVWFGEMPLGMGEIEATLQRADLFAAIGTSGQVYPAAGFVNAAKYAGAKTIEINLASTGTSEVFDEHLLGPASEKVPLWVDTLLGSRKGK